MNYSQPNSVVYFVNNSVLEFYFLNDWIWPSLDELKMAETN